MQQIHSNRVIKVTSEHDFNHPVECDAIITNKTDIPLMVMVADCTPILLYEEGSHAIAAIHAGRAGAFSNIIKNSIDAMRESFGTRSGNIIAILGPSICQQCYEVSEAIYEEAKALGYESAVVQKEERYYLHVNQILEQQLKACGVMEKNIEVMPHCTACESETFFSYRADGGRTGRQAGIIMLRS